MNPEDKDAISDGSGVTAGFKYTLSHVNCKPLHTKSLLTASANTQDLPVELHLGIWKAPMYCEGKKMFADSPHLHRLYQPSGN